MVSKIQSSIIYLFALLFPGWRPSGSNVLCVLSEMIRPLDNLPSDHRIHFLTEPGCTPTILAVVS
jgi:hypothetical protein